MRYTMKELMSVAAALAREYAGYDHSSLPYETIRQLMDAVVYCIDALSWDGALLEELDAMKAYKLGCDAVRRRTEEALKLYNCVMQNFCDYGSRALRETMTLDMPAFFERYDIRFAPQETVLTLDYPVLRDLSALSGVQRIHAYLQCVELEQERLGRMGEAEVTAAMERYDPAYREGFDNLYEIVLQSAY